MDSLLSFSLFEHWNTENNEEESSITLPLTIVIGSVTSCTILALNFGVIGRIKRYWSDMTIKTPTPLRPSASKKKSVKSNKTSNGIPQSCEPHTDTKPIALKTQGDIPLTHAPKILPSTASPSKPLDNTCPLIPAENKPKKKKRKTKSNAPEYGIDQNILTKAHTQGDFGESWITVKTKKQKVSQSPVKQSIQQQELQSKEAKAHVEQQQPVQSFDVSKDLTTKSPSTPSYPREPVKPEIANPCHSVSVSPPPPSRTGSDKQLVQLLVSQVHAKDAECQILRQEVVNLRGQLDSAVASHQPATNQPAPPQPIELCDVGTNTTDPVVEQKVKNSSAPTSATATNSSNDAILLTTLQGEIARQAKLLVISDQRNENLQSRLSTSKKSLDSTNSALSKLKKTQLGLEQRLQAADEANVTLTSQLTEALQSAELQRRKLDQAERNNLMVHEECVKLREDKGILEQRLDECIYSLGSKSTECLRAKVELDELKVQHEATLTDLESSRLRCLELEQQNQGQLASVESHSEVESAYKEQLAQLQASLDEQATRHSTRLEQEQASFDKRLAELTSQLSERDQRIDELVAREAAAASNNNKKSSTELIDNEATEKKEIDAIPVMEVVASDEAATSCSEEAQEAANKLAQYKSALSKTEAILAELQRSVDAEELRWRHLLETANSERQTLEEKSARLLEAVESLTSERDALSETVKKFQQSVPPSTDGNQAEVAGTAEVNGCGGDGDTKVAPTEPSSNGSSAIAATNGEDDSGVDSTPTNGSSSMLVESLSTNGH